MATHSTKKSSKSKDIFDDEEEKTDEDISADELDDDNDEDQEEIEVPRSQLKRGIKRKGQHFLREEKLGTFDAFMTKRNTQDDDESEVNERSGKHSRRNRHEVPLKLYRRIALGFIILTAGLLVFMLVFSATSASIVITPKKEQISVSLLRTVGGTTDKIDGAVYVENINYSEIFSVEQGREVEGFASGNIKVINSSKETVSLIPRTRFQSKSGVIFRVGERVNIPAGGNKTVNVVADVKGKIGEVEQGSFSIPGLPAEQQKLVYGESVGAMKGGVRTAGVLTEGDVAKAEERVMTNLKKQKIDEYRAKSETATFTDVIADINVKQTKINEKVGDEVDEFSVELSARVAVVFFDGAALDTLTRQAIFAKVPAEKRLHTVGDSQVGVENIDAEAKTATLKLTRGGEVTLDPNSSLVAAETFLNKSEEEIQSMIKELDVAESSSVSIRPKWRSRTPSSADRIKVEVK